MRKELDLLDVMKFDNFIVVGDTKNEEKYACRIKKALEKSGYNVYDGGREASVMNSIYGDIDIIDLCVNPVRGLEYVKNCTKPYKGIVIQPGAESDELIAYLEHMEIPFVEGCLLVGLRLYPRRR